MSSVLVARQPVINFLSKGTLNFGQRYLTNAAQCCRLRKISYCRHARLLFQSITDRTLQLRQQHVSSSVSPDQQELERRPPKFYRNKRDKMKRQIQDSKIGIKEFYDSMNETFERWQTENRTPTESDWESFSHEYSTNDEESMILKYDAAVMKCLYRKKLPDFALSFMEHVRKNKTPSLKALTALIAVCGKKYPDIVLKEYEELQKDHPLMDLSNYMNLIVGFSRTKEWKKCLEFLVEVKQLCETDDISVLGRVFEAAVAHDDAETVKYLLKTYTHSHATLLPQRYATAIYNTWSDGRISGETLLKYLSMTKGYLTRDQAEHLKKELCKEDGAYQIEWAKIYRGCCGECGAQLKGEPVTGSQVKLLAERMQKHITSRKNIDIYTSEKEFQHFSSFLEDKQCYDLVIDTANYLYPFTPKIMKTESGFELRVKMKHNGTIFKKNDSETIKRLLEASTGVKIREGRELNGDRNMVLSGKRADVLRARMTILRMNNTVFQLLDKILEPFERILFVTNNGVFIRLLQDRYDFGVRYHMYTPQQNSDDDFFALAAALHSGRDCYLLSGDNFKSLKAEIGPDLGPLFEQWQRRRQIFISSASTARGFLLPQDHDFCVQKDDDGWHVPYETEHESGKNCYYSKPNTLLCLRKKSSDQIQNLENAAF